MSTAASASHDSGSSKAGASPSEGAAGIFVRNRLGSFLAVVPLGAWTINHLWNNLSAFDGREAWQSAVTEYPHPISQLLSFVLVLVPLVLHTLWGLARLFSARPNVGRYRYYGNLKYLLQRLSAAGVLLFLGAHIWLAFLSPRLTLGRPEAFEDIAHEMHHHGPTLAVYLLGTLGVTYHLANGIQTFAMGWGLVSSREALRRLEPVIIGVFLVLLAMAWSAIYALYRAGA
jgi:succinate dehydrogenase / fumarate reductase cytochrome b subunit